MDFNNLSKTIEQIGTKVLRKSRLYSLLWESYTAQNLKHLRVGGALKHFPHLCILPRRPTRRHSTKSRSAYGMLNSPRDSLSSVSLRLKSKFSKHWISLFFFFFFFFFLEIQLQVLGMWAVFCLVQRWCGHSNDSERERKYCQDCEVCAHVPVLTVVTGIFKHSFFKIFND